jgi:hypothetical protein
MIRVLLCSAVGAFMVGCSTAKVTPPSTPTPNSNPIPTPTDPLSVLALPEGLPILCRVPPADPAKPQRPPVLREFRFGQRSAPVGLWPREISIGFDSVGHTFAFSDEVSFGTAGSRNVVAAIGPTGNPVVGMFVEITVDSVALAAAIARGDVAAAQAAARPPVQRELSPSEWAQARALAAWLWQRRCGRS